MVFQKEAVLVSIYNVMKDSRSPRKPSGESIIRKLVDAAS